MNKVFLNLGRQPLANSFLKDIGKNTLRNEFFYNLKICFRNVSPVFIMWGINCTFADHL